MTYPGGKAGAGVYQRIINLIPPHRVYIEPFVGGGAILKRKKLAEISIAIDTDKNVIQDLESLKIARAAVTFINGDGIQFLKNYQWRGDEFVYCDPPYVLSTRKTGAIYNYEMNDHDHKCLLKIIRSIPAAVMISGYPCKFYDRHLSGWSIDNFKAMTRGGSLANECLWMNYSAPKLLHDYEYIGKDFRDRERIKRKRIRWRNKFEKLPIDEKTVIFRELNEVLRGSDNDNNDDDR